MDGAETHPTGRDGTGQNTKLIMTHFLSYRVQISHESSYGQSEQITKNKMAPENKIATENKMAAKSQN